MGKRIYVGAGGEVPVLLPVGYTRVDAIRPNGKRRIDTGYKPNQNTRVVCKARIPVDGATKILFGSRKSTTVDGFTFAASNTDCFQTLFGSQRKYFPAEYNCDDFIHIDKNKRETTITLPDGVSTTITNNSYTFTSPVDMVLFGCNTNGTVAYYDSEISELKIYDNEVLVADYYACVDADGNAGMYDLVDGEFDAGVGEGSFVVTSLDRVVLPVGYKPVEYINLSGGQYVQTSVNIVGSRIGEYKIIADMALTGTSGWRVSGTGETEPMFYLGMSNTGAIAYGNGDTDVSTDVSGDNGRHTWTLDADEGVYAVSGLSRITEISFAQASGERLFSIGGYARTNDSTACHEEKVWRYTFYRAGLLIGRYTPCLNDYGRAGLYDDVNGVFHEIKGTGTVTTGNVIEKDIAKRVRKIYAEINGVARQVFAGYVSVGGVARPFFGNNVLRYYGTADDLVAAKQKMAAASLGSSCFFAGGGYGAAMNTVDVYTNMLAKVGGVSLSEAKFSAAAVGMESVAIVAGGENGSASAKVDAFDRSFTKKAAPNLSVARSNGATGVVGGCMIVAGGLGNSGAVNAVDAYDLSLTKRSIGTVSGSLSGEPSTGASAFKHAFFCHYLSGYTNTVVAYDESLTATTLGALKTGLTGRHAARAGDCVIFGDGVGMYQLTELEAFDDSLTRFGVELFGEGRYNHASATVEDCAVFGFGYGGPYGTDTVSSVDVYDDSLTHRLLDEGGTGRGSVAAATAGDYVLFAGGWKSWHNGETDRTETELTKAVDVFAVI